MTASRQRSVADRVVSGFLLVLMAAGSLALWIVVPAASLKLLLPLGESTGYHLGVGLLAVPVAMLLFSLGLFWLNGLYLRVNGHIRVVDPESPPVRVRGPLEPLMLWSLVAAAVSITVWFLFFAENPALTA